MEMLLPIKSAIDDTHHLFDLERAPEEYVDSLGVWT